MNAPENIIFHDGHQIMRLGPATGHVVTPIAFCRNEETAAMFAEAVNSHAALAARVVELEAAVKALLDCPAIADENHSDPTWGDEETAAAVKAARAVYRARKWNVANGQGYHVKDSANA